MKFETRTVRRTINKAFLKEPIERGSFTVFKDALEQLLDAVNVAKSKNEHEEHFKNFLVPFFNQVGFEDYSINTSVRIDMAIHTGKKGKDPVGVLIEAKRPGNSAEMITKEQINRKAMHEAVLYYLEQRIEQDNSDLKHVIITDMDNWHIFDAQEFERCFYKPSTLRKTWKEWKSDRKVSSNNDFMYGEIFKFIDTQDISISGLWLPLDKTRKFLKGEKDSEYEKKLIPIFKLFTPTHLLKEPFANDSNSLNKEFYRELLYILGLEETKEGSTRYIQRASEKNRNRGSVIENTIRILDAEDHLSTLKNALSSYGDSKDEQLFSVAMELSITWMNRILFLKLLEAQLYRYHRQDKYFKFLNYQVIDSLDELNKLFFQVLARKEKDRSEDVNEKFGHIPYLNSSLFDVSSLEHQTTRISGLEDHAEIPVYSKSVLSKQRGETLNTLDYLFRFLEAYDFSAEGSEEIRDESKSLINASVLGLIFEKINGYKDGSFYTPGFITEYMARETLRKAVVDKFEGVLGSKDISGVNSPSPLHPSPAGEGTGVRAGKDPERGMSASEPTIKLPESLIKNARHLRKNQTDAEEVMWQLLRKRQLNGLKFRRQHPIEEGFILDFYCHEKKLAVELDGAYHNTPEQRASDKEREQFLIDIGVRVIRFSNEEVMEDTVSVLKRIASSALTPAPSPAGEGGRVEGSSPELTFKDIYNRIGRDISIAEANEIINSITICDPAVGSGHFLVSCLNELIAIKSELGILCDTDGKALRGVEVTVENDELIISWGDEGLFEYDVSHSWKGTKLSSRKISPELERVQKTLFHEKRYLIENCLFGVDINPNSVKICRLRLWIELLKRAFYTSESNYLELEVLPNIDINIKQGNSLVSRFELDSDLSTVFKNSDHSLEDYKEAVRFYKQTGDRTEKQRLQQLIDDIKEEYTTTLTNIRPINQKISKARGRLEIMQSDDLFGDVKFTKKEIKSQKKKLKKLEEQKAEEESGAFYNQAFEWRFEFPEVLDDEGLFTGFDVVIGNPPYVRQEQFKELKPYLQQRYSVYQGTADLYSYFIELGVDLLSEGGHFQYIVANKWMRANYGKPLREWLQKDVNINAIYDFGDLPVFEEATTYPCLLQLSKTKPTGLFSAAEIETLDFDYLENYLNEQRFDSDQTKLQADGWALIDVKAQQLLEKLKKKGTPLGKYVDGKIFYGIKTGLNEAFVIDEETREQLIKRDPKSEEIIKPFLRGRDIKRYQPVSAKDYLIFTRRGIKIEDYPAVLEYLKSFKEKLAPRPKDIPSSKWKGRKPGHYKWYEIQDAIDYYEEFEKPKIILPDISLRGNFTLDQDGGFYIVNTAYLIGSDDKFLLGILASDLIDFYYRSISSSYRGGYLRFIYQYLETIPIVKPDDKTRKEIEANVQKILDSKKQNPEADTTALEAEIDRLVSELYGLSEEEVRIVEGERLNSKM
jgi:very-short-patch-repair endonuclease